MEHEIIKEYPTYTFDITYFTFAILESRKCTAFKILDECVISNNIETLRNIYADLLHKKCITNNVHILNPNKQKEYEPKLIEVLTNSNIQRNEVGDKYIDTTHVLMAILADDNIVKQAFEKIGLDYKILKNKVLQNKGEEENEEEAQKEKKNNKKEMVLVSPNNSNMVKPNKKSKTNTIEIYSTNLNKLAENGKIDDLIGREEELESIIKVLSRRNKNNIVLIGNSGSGKTAIINGFVKRIISGNVPMNLYNKEVLSIDMASMIAGTQYRGVFEERMKTLIGEIKEAKKYILFFDDIHIALSERGNNTDVVNMFNTILSDNELQIIATTTFKDYKSSIENYTIISRKLQKIIVEPTNIEDTIEIIKNNKHYYETFHNVIYTPSSIDTCVKLAERYISERCLPDSAIDLFDETGAYVKLKNEKNDNIVSLKNKLNKIVRKKNEASEIEDYEKADLYLHEEKMLDIQIKDIQKSNINNKDIVTITDDDILEVLAKSTKIPVQSLNKNDLKSLANINNVLKKEIFGQDEAVDKVCSAIKRQRINLKSNVKRPISFILIGTSGTGKTMLAKQLAKDIFGNENSLIRMDMSEYSEKHTVSKIIGSPNSYVGYGDETFLLGAIKNKKYCVILLDEIEKACTEVFNIFLTLFDDGYLTEVNGNKVDFSNTIIIMTSNIGTRQASEFKQIGFNNDNSNLETQKEDILRKELKKKFAPEFINRINNIIYFKSLSEENLKKIMISNLEKLNDLLKEKKYTIKYNDKVINWLYRQLKEEDKNYGGRPILRIIENYIEEKLTDLLIENEYEENHIFLITVNKKDELIIK